MGEITAMILDGTLCQECGELFDDGEAPGHPRTCGGCQSTAHRERKARRKQRFGRRR